MNLNKEDITYLAAIQAKIDLGEPIIARTDLAAESDSGQMMVITVDSIDDPMFCPECDMMVDQSPIPGSITTLRWMIPRITDSWRYAAKGITASRSDRMHP